MSSEIKFLRQKFIRLAIELHDIYNNIHIVFYPETKTVDVSFDAKSHRHQIACFYDGWDLDVLIKEYDKLIKFSDE